MPDFYTVITESGLRSLGLATTQGQKLSLTHAVVGDGNGTLVTPSKSMTALVHEVWRGVVSGVHSTEAEPNTLTFEFVIKADIGGFTIREVGLLDENGDLFCIGNFPETEKPVVTDGSVRDLVIRLPLHFENAENVSLVVDTNVAVAIKQDVIDHNVDPLAHDIMKSDAVDLNSSEKVATSKAVKTVSDNLSAHNADLSAHGIVKSDAVNSANSDFATSKAVKTTHDSLTAHKADTTAHGIVKSHAVNSNSSDFATSKAVKTVHDELAQHAANVNTHASATTSAKGFVRLGTANEHVAHTAQNTAATPYGVWKLIEAVKSDDANVNSSVKLATSKAVKTTYDSLTAHKADTAAHGIVKSSAVNSTSTSQFATPKAVKTVNDALAAHKSADDPHGIIPTGGKTGDVLTKTGDGEQWASVGTMMQGLNIVKFTSSGTYRKPANLIAAEVTVTGGGASGGRLYSHGAGGGGAGGTSIKSYGANEIPSSVSIIVGGGGAGNASEGNNGGNSQFLSQVGEGGKRSSQYNCGGAGGIALGGDLNLRGSGGAQGDSEGRGGAGGGSYWGGGSLGSNDNLYEELKGFNGSGGGGRDGSTSRSGSGGDGLVVIKEYLGRI